MKNQAFYVVAATIIPVYFLALTLQGAFYEKFQQYVDSGIESRDAFFLNALRKRYEKGRTLTRSDIPEKDMENYVLSIYRIELIKIISGILVIVVTWPTFGELVALTALYNNKASLWQDIVVGSSLVLLVIATACIILARLYVPYYMLIIRVVQLAFSLRLQSALSRGNNPNHESSGSSYSKNHS